MFAVILAAGRGKRMGDLAADCSKTMLPINGKPKLAYTIESLPDQIETVILIVNYCSGQIKEYFGENYANRKIVYRDQEVLNGTDGALRTAKDLLHDQDKFIVLNGDDMYRKRDLERMLRYDRSTLACYSYDAKKFGIISVDDSDNFEGIMEKSDNHTEGLAGSGAFVLGKEYFEFKPVAISDTEFGLPHTVLSMYEKYPVKVVHTDHWQAVGTPEQYEEAQEIISKFL